MWANGAVYSREENYVRTENGLLACLGHSYLFSVSHMRGDMGDTLWNSFQETEMENKQQKVLCAE